MAKRKKRANKTMTRTARGSASPPPNAQTRTAHGSASPLTASPLPKAAAIVAFTETEEAFFAAGESEPHLEELATVDDPTPQRPSLWRRLLARATLAA